MGLNKTCSNRPLKAIPQIPDALFLNSFFSCFILLSFLLLCSSSILIFSSVIFDLGLLSCTFQLSTQKKPFIAFWSSLFVPLSPFWCLVCDPLLLWSPRFSFAHTRSRESARPCLPIHVLETLSKKLKLGQLKSCFFFFKFRFSSLRNHCPLLPDVLCLEFEISVSSFCPFS